MYNVVSFPPIAGKKTSCKTVARVCTPFTEGHYYGKGEKPNTELADNSAFTYRRLLYALPIISWRSAYTTIILPVRKRYPRWNIIKYNIEYILLR
jgi:hypothetical protein